MLQPALFRSKRALIIIGLAVVVLIGAVIVKPGSGKSKLPTFKTQHGDFRINLTETGELRAANSVVITAPSVRVNLQIVWLAEKGNEVTEGDTLIVFDATELKKAIEEVAKLKEEFWMHVNIPGELNDMNQELQKASRLADFIELGDLMARDGLHREESCGGHFRDEYQTGEGEALRNDKDFTYVSAWEYKGDDKEPAMHKEDLNFEYIEVKQRNYK